MKRKTRADVTTRNDGTVIILQAVTERGEIMMEEKLGRLTCPPEWCFVDRIVRAMRSAGLHMIKVG